ncbi:MAG: hypothetical protein JOZ90_14785, partial [Alphaproteobacteria bacterium]|nr:hypothetical protein [Alphaproteobacteria bacterium]
MAIRLAAPRADVSGPEVVEPIGCATVKGSALLGELMRSVVSEAPIFIGICDATFQPIFVNEAGRRLVGLAPDESLETHAITDFFVVEHRA